jgi:hypothetical protein
MSANLCSEASFSGLLRAVKVTSSLDEADVLQERGRATRDTVITAPF